MIVLIGEYMFDERGTITIKLFHSKVYFHWSILLMFIPLVLWENSFLNIVLSVSATLIIISAHEFGHAFLVHLFGYSVEGIVVHGFGGICLHEEVNYRRENIAIALGGVIFQILLMLILVFIIFSITYHGVTIRVIENIIWKKFVSWNLFIVILNMLPIPGFDGYDVFDINEIRDIIKWKKQKRREKSEFIKQKRKSRKLKMNAKKLTLEIVNIAKKSNSRTSKLPNSPEI
jgi:stage IV sporulation protein FB